MALFRKSTNDIGNLKERGDVLLQQGRWEQALPVWTECEKTCAKSRDTAENRLARVNCLINITRALGGMGRHREALSPLDKARSILEPSTGSLSSWLEEEAEALTSPSPELLVPTPEILALAQVHYRAGVALFGIQEYEDAIDLFRQALTVFDCAEEWHLLAECQQTYGLCSYSLGTRMGDPLVKSLGRSRVREAQTYFLQANDKHGAALASFNYARMLPQDQSADARDAAVMARSIWKDLGDKEHVLEVDAFIRRIDSEAT